LAAYEILITTEFSAAHQLRFPDGTLEPLHGHNWKVELYLEGAEIDEIDVLADFTVVRPQLLAVCAELHDTHLNDHPAFQADNPSTERVAKLIHDQLAPKMAKTVRISRVRVWETSTCAAAYIP